MKVNIIIILQRLQVMHFKAASIKDCSFTILLFFASFISISAQTLPTDSDSIKTYNIKEVNVKAVHTVQKGDRTVSVSTFA